MAQTAFCRYDKVEPMGGSFRAPLAAAISADDVGKVQGVSINNSGRAVIGGADALSIKGVICAVKPMAIGDIIDVMTDGEITNFTDAAGAAVAAGANLYVAFATGIVSVTSTGSPQYVGHTVEASRLVVRVGR